MKARTCRPSPYGARIANEYLRNDFQAPPADTSRAECCRCSAAGCGAVHVNGDAHNRGADIRALLEAPRDGGGDDVDDHDDNEGADDGVGNDRGGGRRPPLTPKQSKFDSNT